MAYRLTEEDKKYILENYSQQSTFQMAEKLGFRDMSIRRFLDKAGKYEDYKTTHKIKKKKRLSESDKKYVLAHFNKKSPNEIAGDLGFTYMTLRRFLDKEGLKSISHIQKKSPKKRDRHDKMLDFAKSLGFKNTSEAISEYGYKEFIKQFKKQSI